VKNKELIFKRAEKYVKEYRDQVSAAAGERRIKTFETPWGFGGSIIPYTVWCGSGRSRGEGVEGPGHVWVGNTAWGEPTFPFGVPRRRRTRPVSPHDHTPLECCRSRTSALSRFP